MAAPNNQPPAPENASSLSPSEARDIFRVNKYYGTTAGFCMDYVQANLVVVPSSLADELKEFCARNSAALPVLYVSQTGETGAPPLAKDSDVRTDIPRYIIFSHGRQVHDMLDLHGFDWKDCVSFYLGCSFSFEKPLLDAGLSISHLKDKKLVSIYVSGIDCYDVGERLRGVKMTLTMRPINKKQLLDAVAITSCYPVSAHGAPIHIGDPSLIGIEDIHTDAMGSTAVIPEGMVPVFWACGVTVREAMKALGADLSFTHYPGSMFITDVTTDSTKKEPTSDSEKPVVIQISPSQRPYWGSVLSVEAQRKIQALEEIILDDPNSCNVREIREEGDYLKSLLVLSHSQYIGLIFGFPANSLIQSGASPLDFTCEETDGPPGAFSLVQALQTLSKKVAIISEKRNEELVKKCSDFLMSSGALKSPLDFISCEEILQSELLDFDVLLSIERSGKAQDGCNYTCKGRDITKLLDPIDELFKREQKSNRLITISIGDRGNELGLGRVRDKVNKYMNGGPQYGCDISSDYVILSGVSNWGGYALSSGLYLLANCPVHSRYVKRGVNVDEKNASSIADFIPTDHQASGVLKVLNDLGVCDGISKSFDQSVDNQPLAVHLEKLKKMREIV
ncbi:PREDICTED: UPF0317 protein C14orf159, mitochondrial-like [Amphimedon queenslandica]|uniref:D-glutamate cyclase-like C-terminal domain-containing protein n=1 Tax=Amphimedon queenslandica TaxID=400682 RepID=A0A1X7VEC4_AMPQE|nr:PREDICTED: UPF0317 protein C14orf159, mitochondrial-like [Amphimedon queenslandica]|eukprot:XP_019849312.1 PREDICTED: UPF0317 protein C14orf159, mitochondrial-like [Amphimedon queenslandica]